MKSTVKTCSIEGCERRLHGSRWCSTHYHRYLKYGSTELPIIIRPKPKTDYPEFRSWSAMLNRCYSPMNKAYERYKGYGVYEEWRQDFWAFYNYIGPKPSLEHTIDRIDSSKGYFPGNVRWATRELQAINRGTFRSNTSGYRGVGFRKREQKWAAYICFQGCQITLGSFKDKELAALAYDAAAIQLFGDEAKPNIL